MVPGPARLLVVPERGQLRLVLPQRMVLRPDPCRSAASCVSSATAALVLPQRMVLRPDLVPERGQLRLVLPKRLLLRLPLLAERGQAMLRLGQPRLLEPQRLLLRRQLLDQFPVVLILRGGRSRLLLRHPFEFGHLPRQVGQGMVLAPSSTLCSSAIRRPSAACSFNDATA